MILVLTQIDARQNEHHAHKVNDGNDFAVERAPGHGYHGYEIANGAAKDGAGPLDELEENNACQYGAEECEDSDVADALPSFRCLLERADKISTQ